MNMLQNKKILIFGISSKLSIAYGIAKAMHFHGAKLAFTYQNEKLKNRVIKYASEFDSNKVFFCDVQDDCSLSKLFDDLSIVWDKFDGFVHSIAFAPRDQLSGDYIDVINRKGFEVSHDVSSYSFVNLAKIFRSILKEGSSLLTLTYLGSQYVVPNYNVMGLAKASLEANVKYMAYSLGKNNIRVNAISAGPIKTLASSAIAGFKKMLVFFKNFNFLKRLISTDEIGNVAAFLCSDLSSGITGEVIHVDGGYNVNGIDSDVFI
ncbi:enoyl-ACP reductase [Candidatus Purcelliella pentastirinorum]|uniref:enoyl-ACP reductase FabI n=1 Tax=Candidatus Purcelliella pentastirinorum TaxID=472834 RepID=UPI002368348B|nr:enoyl-ACP reductase [Candidatus Purcelliella pentastirinorum]WDI78867.1 enoyl-ACP reductase [Candidatus Purcelliella pentastirinorum]WDR80000.1 enoyl-ACP reductase [Candidatus Purcelliella pentastirinorum]